MGKLDGKVAIVTGSGSGLGRAVAKALAKDGAAVTIAELVAEAGLKTSRDIESAGGRALFVQCDVRDRVQIEATVAKTVERFGTVDILVNNAADTRPQGRPIEFLTDEDWEIDYATGPLATFRFMQACLPHLRERAGKIINVSSGAGVVGEKHLASYAAAKEAMRALTRTAAREFGEYGINVNCICPKVATESIKRWGEKFPEKYLEHSKTSPLGRWGDPDEDVAPAVVFLASPEARYITGATIMVDGGSRMFA